MSAKAKPQLTLEQAMENLEKIVEDLEAGTLSLDKSLDAFEEGMKLAKHCDGLLESATGRVEKIMKDHSGQIRSELATEFEDSKESSDDDAF